METELKKNLDMLLLAIKEKAEKLPLEKQVVLQKLGLLQQEVEKEED